MTPRLLLVVLGAAGGVLCLLFALLCFLPKKKRTTEDEDGMEFDDDFAEQLPAKKGKKPKKGKRGKKGQDDFDEDDGFGESVGFTETAPDPFTPVGEAPSNPFGAPPSGAFSPISVDSSSLVPSSEYAVDATEYLRRLFECFESMDMGKIEDKETDTLFASHKTILADYRNSGAQRVTKLVSKKDQHDVDSQVNNGWEYLTTEVNCTIQDYIKDINTGEIAGGSTKDTFDVTYILTFVRPTGEHDYALYSAALV